jgi:hypothetical protein
MADTKPKYDVILWSESGGTKCSFSSIPSTAISRLYLYIKTDKMSMVLIENPWTAGFVYTIALGAIYKASQRNLTVCYSYSRVGVVTNL